MCDSLCLQAWSEAQVKVQAVNNIVDALEAQVSSPETIVAELVSAACAALRATRHALRNRSRASSCQTWTDDLYKYASSTLTPLPST